MMSLGAWAGAIPAIHEWAFLLVTMDLGSRRSWVAMGKTEHVVLFSE